jgi:hypothetical protein
MKDKPVKIPDIGFNEALQRIAKFQKGDLPIDKKAFEVKKTSEIKTNVKRFQE